MPDNEAVLFDIDPREVATVTLNRTAVDNAYNGALIDGLIETFSRLARDAAQCGRGWTQPEGMGG